MINKTLGFVGGGRITRILLEGLTRAGALPSRVVVSDPEAEALDRLRARFPLIATAPANNALAAGQELVFLAVHPPVIGDVTAEIRGAVRPEAIVISLAPKVTLAKLAEGLGGFRRLARLMPNAPSLVNAGFNPLAFSPSLTDADKQTVAELCMAWGCCPQVVEEKLEAFALLTSMGPTYFWFQMYELQNLAVSFGLTTAEAQLGLERLFMGLCKTMAASGLRWEEVRDLVPLKPLSELEPTLTEAYRSRLTAVMQRIKP